MHEVSLVMGLIEQIEAAAVSHQFAKVLEVNLDVGLDSGVSIEALEFCFPLAVQGTCLQDSKIVCRSLPGSSFHLRDLQVL